MYVNRPPDISRGTDDNFKIIFFHFSIFFIFNEIICCNPSLDDEMKGHCKFFIEKYGNLSLNYIC